MGQRKILLPNEINAGGNQISGSGALPGTLRILVGYERVVHPKRHRGRQVGSVITGKARRMDTDSAFLFFHGEARASLWIGKDVFSKPGVRPYLFVSGGIAEASGKILVDFSVPNDPNNINWMPGSAVAYLPGSWVGGNGRVQQEQRPNCRVPLYAVLESQRAGHCISARICVRF